MKLNRLYLAKKKKLCISTALDSPALHVHQRRDSVAVRVELVEGVQNDGVLQGEAVRRDGWVWGQGQCFFIINKIIFIIFIIINKNIIINIFITFIYKQF